MTTLEAFLLGLVCGPAVVFLAKILSVLHSTAQVLKLLRDSELSLQEARIVLEAAKNCRYPIATVVKEYKKLKAEKGDLWGKA